MLSRNLCTINADLIKHSLRECCEHIECWMKEIKYYVPAMLLVVFKTDTKNCLQWNWSDLNEQN